MFTPKQNKLFGSLDYFYSFVVMEAKKQLRARHKESCAALKKIAIPYIDNSSLNLVAIKIGKNLGVSFQTVVNYVYGKAKDGYLTEAITKEFEKL